MLSSLFWTFLPLKKGPYVVPKELAPCAVSYLRREEISCDNLVMQAIVGLHMVRFRVNQFDVVQFGASYASLK
jgi:hypothetical protein